MYTRRTRSLTATAAMAVVLAAAVPAASARPALESSADERAAQPSTPVVREIDGGFDVASATIGAGGAAVILLLTATGAAAASRHHRRIGASQ
jgi:predicted deacylase